MNIQMKEKIMIFIDNFINLFSDWDFFLSNWEKIGYFALGQGPIIGPWGTQKKSLVAVISTYTIPLSRVLVNEQKFNLMYFTNKVKIFVIILEYWLELDGFHDLYHVQEEGQLILIIVETHCHHPAEGPKLLWGLKWINSNSTKSNSEN